MHLVTINTALAEVVDGDSDEIQVEVIIAAIPINLMRVLCILCKGSER